MRARVCVCVCPRGGLALRCSVQLVVSTEAPCQSTGRVSTMRMNMYIPHPVRTSANPPQPHLLSVIDRGRAAGASKGQDLRSAC